METPIALGPITEQEALEKAKEQVEHSVAILTLPDGKIVMQRKDGGVYHGSKHILCLFGGQINDAEEPQAALLRELTREETSLQSGDLGHLEEIFGMDTYTEQATYRPNVRFHVFRAAVENTDFEVYEGVAAAEAYDLTELLARSDVHPSVQAVLEQYRRYLYGVEYNRS